MGSYMDAESMEATITIKSSSLIWIIGYNNPISRKHDEHTWFVVRLRVGPVTVSPNDLQVIDNSHLIPCSKHVHH